MRVHEQTLLEIGTHLASLEGLSGHQRDRLDDRIRTLQITYANAIK